MSLFKKVDDLLIAGFQWVVNKTGRKPRWYCKQATVLLTLGAFLRPFEHHDLGWLVWVGVLCHMLMAGSLALVAWFCPDELLKREHPFWRWFWLGLVAAEFAVPPVSPARAFVNICIFMYFCFASCDNPPPPKRKTESKKSTSFWGFLLPSPNPNS